jgi:hypothetical protein
MTFDIAAADAAIAETRKGLEASGFRVTCAHSDGVLTVSVVAGPGACAECLVPRRVLESIIGSELGGQGIRVESVKVVYPADLSVP